MTTKAIDPSAAAPPIRFDDQGHAIPPTEAEREARSEALRKGLELLAAIADDPAESDEEFMRAIDAGRPHRPLFTAHYRPAEIGT